MKDQAIEVVTLGEGGEVLASLRRMVVIEFDDNSTLVSLVLSSNSNVQNLTIVVSSATSVAMVSEGLGRRGCF
jgi:hypothetical protein